MGHGNQRPQEPWNSRLALAPALFIAAAFVTGPASLAEPWDGQELTECLPEDASPAPEALAGVCEELIDTELAVCPEAGPESWYELVPRLGEGEPLASDEILFVTHASAKWDTSRAVAESLNDEVARAIAGGVPVVYLIHEFDEGSLGQYYLLSLPNYIYHSLGGEHEIDLRANTVTFTGGYFYYCSGETVRDAILALADHGDPIRLRFLANSLYLPAWPGMAFPGSTPLKQHLSGMDDAAMMNFLKTSYFRDGEVGLQNWGEGGRHASDRDFTFVILRDGRRIGEFGSGPTQVEMDFIFR